MNLEPACMPFMSRTWLSLETSIDLPVMANVLDSFVSRSSRSSCIVSWRLICLFQLERQTEPNAERPVQPYGVSQVFDEPIDIFLGGIPGTHQSGSSAGTNVAYKTASQARVTGRRMGSGILAKTALPSRGNKSLTAGDLAELGIQSLGHGVRVPSIFQPFSVA